MKFKIILIIAAVCIFVNSALTAPLENVPAATNLISNEQKILDSANQIGNKNTNLDVLNASPQLLANVLVASPVTQLAGPLGIDSAAKNVVKNSQTQSDTKNVIGSKNTNVNVGKVSPQLDVGLGVLSSLTQGIMGGNAAAAKTANVGNVISSTQNQKDTRNIIGNKNTNIDTLKASPQIKLSGDILSDVRQIILPNKSDIKAPKPLTETVVPKVASNKNPVASPAVPKAVSGSSGKSANTISKEQAQTDNSNTIGDGNLVAKVLKANPQAIAGVGVLDTTKQIITGGSAGGASNTQKASQTMNSNSNTVGNKNIILDAVEVGLQGIVGLDALSSSNQIIGGKNGAPKNGASNNIGASQSQTDNSNTIGDGNLVAKVLKVNPQANAGVGVLDSTKQIVTGGSAGGASNTQKASQTMNSNSNTVGNKNIILDPAEVGLQGIIGLDALSSTNQIIGGKNGATKNGASNIIGSSQSQNSNKKIEGNNNLGVALPKVVPQLGVDLGIANGLLQKTGLNAGSGGKAQNAQEISQSMNDRTDMKGDGNTFLGLGKIAPQIFAKLDLLTEVKQLIKILQDPSIILTGDGETCENARKILQDQNSEFNVIGDNNVVVNGPEVSPQLIADLNLLSSLVQSGQCQARAVTTTTPAIPISTPTPTPVTLIPTTSTVSTPPPVTPPLTTTTPISTTTPIISITTTPRPTNPPITIPVTTPPPPPPTTTTAPTPPPTTTTAPTTPPPPPPPTTTTAPTTTPPPPPPPPTTLLTTLPPTTVVTIPITQPPIPTTPTAIPPPTTPRRRCFRRFCRKWRTNPRYVCKCANS